MQERARINYLTCFQVQTLLVPSEGFEPPSLASKAIVLSIELRGQILDNISSTN